MPPDRAGLSAALTVIGQNVKCRCKRPVVPGSPGSAAVRTAKNRGRFKGRSVMARGNGGQARVGRALPLETLAPH
jgi:hypothetical protein